MRSALLVGAAVAVLGAAAYLVAGSSGAVVASAALTTLAAIVARGMLPPEPVQPGHVIESPAAPDFPSYRRISALVSWSGQNAHYYDAVARSYLATIAAALLADRRRLGPDDHAAACLGPAAWALIDPSGRRAEDAPVDLDALENLIDRLEAL
jgi:hypothetical protein